MLIRHPTSGLFWSVNDSGELCLTNEGSVYDNSSCGVPAHVASRDQNTSHLKNTVTGKCICRRGDTLIESQHGGIPNDMFEWTVIDGMIQNYNGLYVEDDLSLVESTSTQWHTGPNYVDFAPSPVVVAVEEEDVPVARSAALIEEALNAAAADDDVPDLVTDGEEEEEEEVPVEVEEAIAETVAEVFAPEPVTEVEEDEVEA